MICVSNLFFFVLFFIWSLFLRHFASFLIKNCVSKTISTGWISITDLITALVWMFAVHQLTYLLPAYFIFLSALLITIYTDFQHMLISRFASLYLVPVGFLFAYTGLLPLSLFESVVACCAGYSFFWIANKLFYILRKHDGLGQGDLELIACVGAFTGFLGCWFTLLVGSVLATICGCLYMLLHKKTLRIMPFGPFLAIAAIIFVLFQLQIVTWLVMQS